MIAHPEYPTEGEWGKLNAHVLLEARRELYILRGRRALLSHLLTADHATADHVRKAVLLPDGIGPKLFGVVPGPLARAGIIEPDGFKKSRRREAHARPVQVWQLVDRAAALAWLSAHPDRPDPLPVAAEADGEPTLFDFDQNDAPGAATPGARQLRKGFRQCTTILTHVAG